MSNKLTIGMFGFGVVGQGLYDIIKTKNLIWRSRNLSLKTEIKSARYQQIYFLPMPKQF
jgi:homoserine dehydrogenase